MPADPAADFSGVLPAAVVEAAVTVLARGRISLSLGVTEQHQTAHGRKSRFGHSLN
jgi:hypothetical protein